jgi:hypothetical protein
MSTNRKTSAWQPTSVQNLIRYIPSGVYFARFKIGGKLIRKSLKTNVQSVAKLRLPDLINQRRGSLENRKDIARGKMCFEDAVTIYQEQIASNSSLKNSTKEYWKKIIGSISRSWPDVLQKDLSKINDEHLRTWLLKYSNKYSPSVVNNSVSAMRAIFEIGIQKGTRFNNPARMLKRVSVRPKKTHPALSH